MEIEAKFALTEPVSAERIEALDWGAYQLGERHTVDQHNTLFDTPDQALSRSGHTARLRTGGEQPLVTLKGPGRAEHGVHSRDEWEAPTSDLDPGGWPESIRHQLRDLIGDQTIQPLLTMRNRRRSWLLRRGDHTIGELALDEGEILAGGRGEPIHELEIELKDGSRDDLTELCALVQRQLPARPEDRSKAERGLDLLRQSPLSYGERSNAPASSQGEHHDG